MVKKIEYNEKSLKIKKEIGTAKVLALFQHTKEMQIIGVKVTSGKIVLADFRGKTRI